MYISKQKRAGIISMDEHPLAVTTELWKSGPRSRLYSDPMLGATRRKMVSCSCHSSVTGSRETLPVYGMFDEPTAANNPSAPRPASDGHASLAALKAGAFFQGKDLTQRPAAACLIAWTRHV